ncbi:MAG: Calcium-transporting ATPase 1 [Betaproteobacteria bacterium ADurb.Bin341]|nr:MAG: Calcium-transporting ATPase 1 [Betaproteobacteria bacterium ADurb.Bin341]
MTQSSETSGALPWHAESTEVVARRLEADAMGGLKAAEAATRLAKYGRNRLTEKPPLPAWRRFVDQFKSALIGVLVLAAVVASFVGDFKDSIVILVVVVFNAVLGFYQEARAEKSLAALKNMLAQKARVRRDGIKVELAADELVPGDLVLLEAGDKVPADGRLIAAHSLEIDESTLTGESHAVAKITGVVEDAHAALAERANMAFMNTVVTRGRAELLVTTTGMQTEMGRIAGMMQEDDEALTPLQVQLDGLGKRLAMIAGFVVALIFVLALLRGEALASAMLTAITLAVAAIPEGLPAVVTVTLALGMRRMAGQRAIVKRLAAVETLGCTTVICSDKTGTLTLNQMTARAFFYQGRRFAVEGEGYEGEGRILAEDGSALPELSVLLRPAALCNDSRIRGGQLIGDPTEGALVALACKGGVEMDDVVRKFPRIAEIPFDSANKFMATFHHVGEQVVMFVKGAPDVLLEHCAVLSAEDGETALDMANREALLAENEAMAGRGLRVLAIASRSFAARDFDPDGDLMQHVGDLCLQGLVGIMDPPRPEAREAIALCRTAGIEVKMITGDHRATAVAIARELGLSGEALTGADLDAMSEEELAACIERVSVFARVAPEHKVKLVQALKRAGHVVAMTGDGVNDAPALKRADIGIAMGITGTEVTKEAGSMVLTDDNFASIVRAVKEGRTIYDNLVKFVRFQLSTNMGALGTVLGASLLGLPVPLNPVQILWVNIIMDGPPAMALGVDPERKGIMADPPRRPGIEILNWQRLAKLAFFGLIMTVGTLGVLWYGLRIGSKEHALTMAFTTFVLFQFFNIFNARAEFGSAFNRNFFRNRLLWLALLCVVGLQVLVVNWLPAQVLFRTTALSFSDWVMVSLVASSTLVLEELYKWIMRWRRISRDSSAG